MISLALSALPFIVAGTFIQSYIVAFFHFFFFFLSFFLSFLFCFYHAYRPKGKVWMTDDGTAIWLNVSEPVKS